MPDNSRNAPGLVQEKIQSLIIPLRYTNMILPQSSVAEIIPVVSPQEKRGVKPWFTGLFTWRAQQVPLISVETLCDSTKTDQFNKARRIAVLYGLENIPGIEYLAIEIQAIPHPVLLGHDDLISIESSEECEVIKRHVQAVGIKAFLPDMSFIEHTLKDQLESL